MHYSTFHATLAKARAIIDLNNKTNDELEEIMQESKFTHVQRTPNGQDMNMNACEMKY